MKYYYSIIALGVLYFYVYSAASEQPSALRDLACNVYIESLLPKTIQQQHIQAVSVYTSSLTSPFTYAQMKCLYEKEVLLSNYRRISFNIDNARVPLELKAFIKLYALTRKVFEYEDLLLSEQTQRNLQVLQDLVQMGYAVIKLGNLIEIKRNNGIEYHTVSNKKKNFSDDLDFFVSADAFKSIQIKRK